MEWPIPPLPVLTESHCQHYRAPILSTSTTAKASHKFFQVIGKAIQCLLGVLNHARLDRHYCSQQLAGTIPTDANGCQWMPTIISLARRLIKDSARTSLYSMSRCHHSQLNCEAGRSIDSSNHCFMIASFQERVGNKLAAHQHHGQAQSARAKAPSSWLGLCLDVSGVFWWPKRT